ncbi:hypothetical protein ACGIF2_16850 [Cellulomonas sp. P22]|uniref:hypothetical protein n=1 Tax=Cellulomonas sp. P22 TaxID=3373189 RepID=UPI00379FA826
MSVLDDVLREVSAGATSDAVARRLGLDPGLVEAMVDHWERLGVVHRAGDVLGQRCGSACSPAGGDGTGTAHVPAGCAGCPIARR